MPETRKITRNMNLIWVQDGRGDTVRILTIHGTLLTERTENQPLGAWRFAWLWSKHSLGLWFQDMAAILRGGR